MFSRNQYFVTQNVTIVTIMNSNDSNSEIIVGSYVIFTSMM